MLKCSHILCKVNNISNVVRDYKALGFSIEWASVYNALLWFKEGPFIEFFEMPKLFAFLSLPFGLVYGRAAGKRWIHWNKCSKGWCDVALEPTESTKDLRKIKLAINQAGISTSRIVHGKRIRPDGLKVKYSLFCPYTVNLPFVVSEYNPPQRPEKIKHPNGATGVEWVKMEVTESYFGQFHTLIKRDKRLKIEPSSQTRIFEVNILGLKRDLDPRYLHGAVFTTTEKKSINT